MNRNQLGVAEYFERIIVSVPHSLKDALGYSDSEVEIEQFTQGLIDKSFEFFASLLDILIEMHAQRIANKQ